jgi:hypothetical protein
MLVGRIIVGNQVRRYIEVDRGAGNPDSLDADDALPELREYCVFGSIEGGSRMVVVGGAFYLAQSDAASAVCVLAAESGSFDPGTACLGSPE